MRHIDRFLKVFSVDHVVAPVHGELNEYSDEHATFFYGNGELIISPADESQSEETYYYSNYNGFGQLVRDL